MRTPCASSVDGTLGDHLLEMEKMRVQRVINSLDYLCYSHSIGTACQSRLASLRRHCSWVSGCGIVERRSQIQRAVNSLDRCTYLVCIVIPCQGLCGPPASFHGWVSRVEAVIIVCCRLGFFGPPGPLYLPCTRRVIPREGLCGPLAPFRGWVSRVEVIVVVNFG